MLKERYKASTTIELAMMMPVVLLVITVVINASFYYHDKNVIYGKVYELSAIALQQERISTGLDAQELTIYYQDLVEGKLLLFGEVSCGVVEKGDGLEITVAADKGMMSLNINKAVPIYYVEQSIRRLQSVTGN